jgi:hypothetical protein
MFLIKGHLSRLATILAFAGLLGTPSGADVGLCGAHSVDDIDLALSMNSAIVDLTDGVVMGRSIADMSAPGEIFRVGEHLSLMVHFDGAPRIEFELELADAESVRPLSGNAYRRLIADSLLGTGCDDPDAVPMYVGLGHWLSADGQVVPARMEFFLWLSPNGTEEEPMLFAMGVLRSEWLNGNIQFNNLN